MSPLNAIITIILQISINIVGHEAVRLATSGFLDGHWSVMTNTSRVVEVWKTKKILGSLDCD